MDRLCAVFRAVPDSARREQELLLALARQFDDIRRRLIGEEIVLEVARTGLCVLGQLELAREFS